jgi:1-acyl-sn-glycerol-3-phosphate acyltransferase
MHSIYRLWTLINFLIVSLCNKVEWQITGSEGLNKKSWYLIIANHQSWLDIFVLTHFARTRIPEPKFFLKESLKKVPFVGMACWALDMPFMKRYSQSFIEKYPHLKGKDIETTKKSCQQYKHTPTTIINFVEGTRFTKEKKQDDFNYILPPKAGGIAFTLAAMGNQFDKILNITLIYPDNTGHVMKDMFSGNLRRIVVNVEQIKISEDVIGNYYTDSKFKSSFQQWINEQWKNKDQLIGIILSNK